MSLNLYYKKEVFRDYTEGQHIYAYLVDKYQQTKNNIIKYCTSESERVAVVYCY